MKKLAVVLIIIVCVIAAWWVRRLLVKEPEVAPVPESALETKSVTLYFGSRDGQSLVPESRDLRARDDVIGDLRVVVEALIGGPQEKGVPTLPSGTRLMGVYIHEKTAYLDFSREIVDPSTGGTSGEYIMISSIVNTVCSNFESVDAVSILVEGKEVDSLGGHLLLSSPLRPEDWR